jgi:hypothetical protein
LNSISEKVLPKIIYFYFPVLLEKILIITPLLTSFVLKYFEVALFLKNRFTQYTLVIVPVMGFLLVLFLNRHGIGVTPDSVMYYSAGEYFLNHGEFRTILEGPEWQFLAHYPPGYPMILAFGNLFIEDICVAASVLNAFFLGLTLFLVGALLRKDYEFQKIILIQFVLLVFCSFLRIYEMIWSEGFYLIWAVLVYLFAVKYQKSTEIKHLIFCGLGIMIACYSRYVGVTLLMTTVLFFYIENKGSRHFLFYKRYFIFSIGSISLLLFWMIRNKMLMDSAVNRSFSFHPVSLDAWQEMFLHTSSYFLPFGNSRSMAVILGAIIFSILVFVSVRFMYRSQNKLVKICALNFWVYFLFLLFTNTFLDQTPLYSRTLMPIYFFLILGMTILLLEVKNKWIKGMLGAYLVLHVLFTLGYSFKKNNGISFSHSSVVDNELVEFCSKLPNEIIYSNEPDRLYHLSKGKVLPYWQVKLSKDTKQAYFILFNPGRGMHENFWSDIPGEWKALYRSNTAEVRRLSETE